MRFLKIATARTKYRELAPFLFIFSYLSLSYFLFQLFFSLFLFLDLVKEKQDDITVI